jgi:hypothetical protein
MDAVKQFNLGERIALEWVVREIEELFEHSEKHDIIDKDVRDLAKRITRRIDKIWEENS